MSSINPSSKSVVLKPFHVRDPLNDMYLSVDPHALKMIYVRDFNNTNVVVKVPRTEMFQIRFYMSG